MGKELDLMLGLGNSWWAKGNALTIGDIRELLIGFDAAIEQDQLRVDALTRVGLDTILRDSMCLLWRCSHRSYINQLLSTLNAMSSEMLEQLTWIARCYEPAKVGDAMLNVFSQAISESCLELGTATVFFGCLIEDLRRMPPGILRSESARALMMQWLPATDPLRIAHDEECGQGRRRIG
jgi:hypothetical protein